MAMRRKKASKKKVSAEKAANKKALWKAYKDLQRRADMAWDKFRSDVRRRAKTEILVKDHNHLLLLLGECNYMARECMRIAAKTRKKKR